MISGIAFLIEELPGLVTGSAVCKSHVTHAALSLDDRNDRA